MAQFDYKKFLREGGIEKYLMEANFGNDLESRYEYIRPLMSKLPDSARTETLIDGMEDGLREDDKELFDYYFVEAMKELGLEQELMEPEDVGDYDPEVAKDWADEQDALYGKANFVEEGESLINPEAEEIDAEDLDAAADYFDSLAENDDVLDEMIAEGDFQVGDLVYFKGHEDKAPMKVLKVRRMFGSNLDAITTEKGEYDETQLVRAERAVDMGDGTFQVSEVEGEVQTENKALDASNELEKALNSVVDELTDDQIDSITNMILDLRDKVKAKKK